MIKLDVQDYCHRCPDFEAEVTGGPSSVYNTEGECGEIFMADTVIRCTRAEKCAWVVGEAFRCRSCKSLRHGKLYATCKWRNQRATLQRGCDSSYEQ